MWPLLGLDQVSVRERSAHRADDVLDSRIAATLLRGVIEGRQFVTGERWTLDVTEDTFVLNIERPDE